MEIPLNQSEKTRRAEGKVRVGGSVTRLGVISNQQPCCTKREGDSVCRNQAVPIIA